MKSYKPVFWAGIVLGIGLGGFVDGIVLHQILQWHHMLSATFPPTSVGNLQVDTLADGLFHAGTWVVTAVGLAMLWRAGRRSDALWSPSVFIGALLMGWGLFDLVEGLIDHQILGIHHVRPGPNEFAYDMGFLAFGALLTMVGWLLVRRGRSAEVTERADAARGAATRQA